MSASWGSDVVNGQLVPRAPASAIFPLVFSAEYTGPGIWPKQGTYQVPPIVPGAYLASNQAPGSMGSAAGGGGGSAMGGAVMPTNASAAGNPWHPTQGIILFAFGFLAVSLFALHYIHWR
jgi:hypothetical protein